MIISYLDDKCHLGVVTDRTEDEPCPAGQGQPGDLT